MHYYSELQPAWPSPLVRYGGHTHTGTNTTITSPGALCKAASTPATMSKQHSTLLRKTATMSNEIPSFRQSRNKLNTFNLFRRCRKHEISFDIVAETGNIVAKNGNNDEANIRLCWHKNRSTCTNRQRCFDIVAGVDGASQTSHHSAVGFHRRRSEHPQTARPTPQTRRRQLRRRIATGAGQVTPGSTCTCSVSRTGAGA